MLMPKSFNRKHMRESTSKFSISEDFENNDITMLQGQVKLNIRVIKSNSPLSINKFSISHSLIMNQNQLLCGINK